jgi:hypothetical protein
MLLDFFSVSLLSSNPKIHCRIDKSHCLPSDWRLSRLNLFQLSVSFTHNCYYYYLSIIQRIFSQTTRQVMGVRIGRANSDTVVPRDRHLRHQSDSLNSFRVTNNIYRLTTLVSYAPSNFSISQRQRIASNFFFQEITRSCRRSILYRV